MNHHARAIFFLLFMTTMGYLPMARGKAYLHEPTRILLPETIAGHQRGEPHVFSDPRLGEAIRYSDKNTTATVYFYPADPEKEQSSGQHEKASRELSKAIGELRRLEELGAYEHVNFAENGRISGNKNTFSFITVPGSFDMVKNPRTRETISRRKIETLIGVGVYRDHFVKLRYSSDRGTFTDEAKKKREAFAEKLVSIVLETHVRPEVQKWLGTYLEDPLGETGKTALGNIVAYAEESALIQIHLDFKVLPWMQIEDYPYSMELLGAFIAGQVQAQLNQQTFKNMENEGMDQVLKVYRQLRQRDEGAKIAELEKELRDSGALK